MRALILTSLVVAACNNGGGLLEPPSSPEEGIQLTMKVTVEPGQETTVCKNFAMPQGAFDVGRFEHAMTPVSHHLLVYPLSITSDQVTDELIYACDESAAVQETRTGILYGTQSPTSDLPLPEGIAFGARGGLAVQLEYHLLNVTDAPVDAEVALNLWRAKGTITGEAGMLFMFHNRIAIAPQSRGEARQRCRITNDLQLLTLVPHMHSRGVAMQAQRATGTGSPQPLFDLQGWENDTVVFDPPVSFAPNDFVDYRCEYDNPSASYVFDGFSARNDEMCVTGGIYFRYGDRLPIFDEFCFGEGIVYTGTNNCRQIEACDASIDWGNPNTTPTASAQYDFCMLSGCQAGADAYAPYDGCRWEMCRTSCFTLNPDGTIETLRLSDPACTSCVTSSCGALDAACNAATCP